MAFTAQTAVSAPTSRNARAAASMALDTVLANRAPPFAKLAARTQEGFAAPLFKIYKLAAHA
jgi:hypothetical protein